MHKIDPDEMMKNFVRESKEVLQTYDKYIYGKLTTSKCEDFYNEEWKGIGVWGIAEPILRFIISTELCGNYRIVPEYQYDDGSKCRADLVLYLDDNKYKEKLPPDIVIEMKWGSIRKQDDPGSLSQWSINKFEEDLKKIRDHSDSAHNYILQVLFAPREIRLNKKKLENQIMNDVDGRTLRYLDISLLTVESCNTHSTDKEKTDYSCWLICWKTMVN
jgi:hypothetical protein